jgi:hypothetical protein
MNDSEHDTRDSANGEEIADSDPAAVSPVIDDLSPAAADRIRHFMAESTVRGGASPSDVADLYTSNEIMADDQATTYLDRRFVHGDVPEDWRTLQDQLSLAHFAGSPNESADGLLARVDRANERAQVPRSIFDDPDEDELEDEERDLRLEERDPSLTDLGDDGRRSIERYIVSEVLCYGVAPFKVMQLREDLRVAGDERSLQYLDLPFELGDRPADWDGLRDRALMTRARLESRGLDPAEAYTNAERAFPDASAAQLLDLIEEQADRR